MIIGMVAAIAAAIIALVIILLRIRSSEKKAKQQQINAMKRAALDEALKNTSLNNSSIKGRIIRLKTSGGTYMFEEGNRINVGRAADNDIMLPDSGVSKHHFSIYSSGTKIMIEDRASRNGTLIKRHGKIRRVMSCSTELEQNDIIIAGETAMEFRLLEYMG